MKYLANRYEKGQKAVAKFMEQKHKYVQMEHSLLECQADLLQWQGDVSHAAVSSLPAGCMQMSILNKALLLWMKQQKLQSQSATGIAMQLPQTVLDSLGDHSTKLQETIEKLNQNPLLRLYATCKLASNDAVTVTLTADFQCWLVNDGDTAVALPACELFGFGLGSFSEIGASARLRFKLKGVARGAGDRMLPWLLQSDIELMVLVNVDSGGSKKLTCLAEIACQTCQTTGITDLSMIDHDISAKLEAGLKYLLQP
eukprot:s4346_g10.t1